MITLLTISKNTVTLSGKREIAGTVNANSLYPSNGLGLENYCYTKSASNYALFPVIFLAVDPLRTSEHLLLKEYTAGFFWKIKRSVIILNLGCYGLHPEDNVMFRVNNNKGRFIW